MNTENALTLLKDAARRLEAQSKAMGATLKHHQALDQIALKKGYKNWRALRAAIETQGIHLDSNLGLELEAFAEDQERHFMQLRVADGEGTRENASDAAAQAPDFQESGVEAVFYRPRDPNSQAIPVLSHRKRSFPTW